MPVYLLLLPQIVFPRLTASCVRLSKEGQKSLHPLRLQEMVTTNRLSQMCSNKLQEENPTIPSMPEFAISTKGILKFLGTNKPNKLNHRTWPIKTHFLRDLWETIAPILQRIFTLLYETGKVPRYSKQANMVPIYKKGLKNQWWNYRPLSLTCICSKMMEHIITSPINIQTSGTKLLQVQRRSLCEIQFINFTNDLQTGSASSCQVDIIVMNFATAFDIITIYSSSYNSMASEARHTSW